MYNWNNKQINLLIKQLKTLNKTKTIKEDIYNLKSLKSMFLFINSDIKYNIKNEYEHYKKIKHYNHFINTIIKKYQLEEINDVEFKKIDISKKEMLTFAIDNIRNISTNWANTIEPYILKEYRLNIKKHNSDFVMPITTLNDYFISLSKNNNISDFVIPTHEFLHIYSALLNYNSLDSTESEFLSILGELITTYEMKQKNIYVIENIKYELDNINRLLDFISDIPFRKKIIQQNKKNNTTIYKTYKNYDLNRKDIKDIYLTNIEYDYQTIISFFIALELFEIYKLDKEKCIYITENIIKSDDKLNIKLKNNNIILQDSTDYIKQLKKEYVSIDNL